MLFDRFEDADLSHYSYAVGCPGAGRVAIVDPRRDIEVYLDYARDHGVAISHVLETHIHADFASGARELAEVTGAELMLSAYDEGEAFDVSFPHTEVREGDSATLGNVRIEALHTPGHTPEHLSFLVYDLSRSDSMPGQMLSGDFLFVGSIGRPDLLGEEAKRGLANRLYESVTERLPDLPDGLEIHPAHGSGSMCGAGIGGRPMSTLGYERIANPYLQPMTREQFVDRVLGNVPPFPDYYRRMKQLNAEGPPALRGRAAPEPLDAETFAESLAGGAVAVDLRDKDAFAGAHVASSLYVGHRPSTWGAWVVPYETPILLVARSPEHAEEAQVALARVGLDDVRGFLAGGLDGWAESGRPVARVEILEPDELHQRMQSGDHPAVLDVRGDAPWRSGHVEGAHHVIAGELQARVGDLPAGPVAVVCNTGFQSTVAAAVLQRAGRHAVSNVAGGMNAWKAAGLPVTIESERVEETA